MNNDENGYKEFKVCLESFAPQVHPVSEDAVQSGPVRILNGENLNGLWYEPPGNGELWDYLQ